MKLKINATEVWVAALDDVPGSLARTLTALANAGARPESIVARRHPEKGGPGEVFVTPLGNAGIRLAAETLGFSPAGHVSTLRIEAPYQSGCDARIAQAVGAARINMRGFTATKVGRKLVCYLGFDSAAEAAAAVDALREPDPAPVHA